MDKKKIESIISWAKENPQAAFDVDCDKYFFEPLMEAFGDDVNDILEYLDNMDVEELAFISGCFEYIYGKFMSDEVYDALEGLEKKI